MTEHLLVSLTAILALGIGAQWVAWRLRLPSILLLLVCGFLAGPVFGWLNPDGLLGNLLMPLVSVSVGLILFEGGLTLKFSELKAIGSVVRNLITVGALISWILVTVAARFCFGWDWTLATLLGAVMIVTGPTVIMPLLRHIQPARQVGSTLKWEGILIDPVGATLALLVFEAIIAQGDQSLSWLAISGLGKTIVIGGALGALGGLILIVSFKRYWVPDYLQNPVSLMMAVMAFTAANHLQHESGLLATTIMGLVLANQKSVHIRHIVEFKENLRVLLISVLFILLSARLDLDTIRQLNPVNSLVFVGVLILVVRPLTVICSTIGSKLSPKERAFLSWMAPRGIVAAAVSSIFAVRLAEANHPSALELVPVTFLVIVGTVTIYGLTSGPFARWLGLSTPNPQGVLFVGATPLARLMARALRDEGVQVLLVDTNRQNTSAARLEGLSVFFGNILGEHSRDELDLAGIGKLIALTANHEVNSLSALHFVEFFGRGGVYQIRVHADERKRTMADVHGRLLFGPDDLAAKLERRASAGAVIRKTRLTEEFTFEEWKQHHPEAIPLFLLTDGGTLKVFTEDSPLNPGSGQTVFALSSTPPDTAPPASAPSRPE